MPWQAINIVLSDDDRQLLESWGRAGSGEYRNVLRAKIILGAADGKTTGSIAKELGIAGQTVSKWRGRFAAAPSAPSHRQIHRRIQRACRSIWVDQRNRP